MKRAIVIEWDGKALPSGLRRAAPGRYRLQSIGSNSKLTPEEDAGLARALDQLDAGKGKSLAAVIASIRRRPRRRTRRA